MGFITNKQEAILIVKLLKIALEKDKLDLQELIVANELLCDIKHYAED